MFYVSQDHDYDAHVRQIQEYDREFKEYMQPIVTSINRFYGLLGSSETDFGALSIDPYTILSLPGNTHKEKEDHRIANNIRILEDGINDYVNGDQVNLRSIDECISKEWDIFIFIFHIDKFTNLVITCLQNTNSIYKQSLGIMGKINLISQTVFDLRYAMQSLRNDTLVGLHISSKLSSLSLKTTFNLIIRRIQGLIEEHDSALAHFTKVCYYCLFCLLLFLPFVCSLFKIHLPNI